MQLSHQFCPSIFCTLLMLSQLQMLSQLFLSLRLLCIVPASLLPLAVFSPPSFFFLLSSHLCSSQLFPVIVLLVSFPQQHQTTPPPVVFPISVCFLSALTTVVIILHFLKSYSVLKGSPPFLESTASKLLL